MSKPTETTELTDHSFLLFADIGLAGKRKKQRIDTLCGGDCGKHMKYTPRPLQALEKRGWIEVRRAGEGDFYTAEMTDEGLAKYREMMASFREAVCNN